MTSNRIKLVAETKAIVVHNWVGGESSKLEWCIRGACCDSGQVVHCGLCDHLCRFVIMGVLGSGGDPSTKLRVSDQVCSIVEPADAMLYRMILVTASMRWCWLRRTINAVVDLPASHSL